MARNSRVWMGVVGSAGYLALAIGCNPSAFQRPSVIPLTGGFQSFDVTAGEPSQQSGTSDLGDLPITLGSGSIEIDPSVITVTPSGSGKFFTRLQDNDVLRITVWVGTIDEEETVCTTGDEYGPYDVTLDENLVPVSVDPSTVNLRDSTLDALNSGEFSLCVEVVSPVTGEVTIESLTFNLGL